MIAFLLKASVVVTFLLLFYRLVLSKESFFAAHRIYLLGGLVLVFMLPFLKLPQMIQEQGMVDQIIESHLTLPTAFNSDPAIQSTEFNDYVTKAKEALPSEPHLESETVDTEASLKKSTESSTPISVEQSPNHQKKGKGVWYWIGMIYWFGFAVFALRLIAQLIGTLLEVFRTQDKIIDEDYVIINMEKDSEPCSFFHYIFIHPQAYDYETYEQILAHERIHVRQRHSIDLLLTELALVVLWFNPIIWLYRREVEKNIEYQTDALLVQNDMVEKEQYQINLVKVATFNQPLSITTNYNQSLIKQRILKMNAKKSNLYSYWKYAFAAPLVLGVLLILNKPINSFANSELIELDQSTMIGEPDLKTIKHRTEPEEQNAIAVKQEALNIDLQDNVPIQKSKANKSSIEPVLSECKKLIVAVYEEDVAQVKALLTDIDPNCVDPDPDEIIFKKGGTTWKTQKAKTALVVAAEKGNLEITKLLVEAGANVNQHEEWDAAPLMGAAESGNLALVKYLRSKGAEVNNPQKHMGTALMAAAKEGHTEIVQYLIAEGANVNEKIAHVGTPLMLAARGGEVDAVELILSKGAEIDEHVAHVGTPMILAAREGHLAVVQYLVKKGASLNKHVAHVGTPLLMAARENKKEVMQFLLDSGVDVNGTVAHVGSPLLLAAREGKKDMIELLIANGADIDQHVAHVGTPLLVAAREGNKEVVTALLAKGADVNKEVAHVGTPLLVAAREGETAVVKILIAKGADVNKEVAHVGTPMLVAAREGKKEIVDLLIAEGADINRDVAHVGTPLTVAAREGNLKTAQFLIKQAADVDKHVAHVGTPLILATREGNLEMMKYLVQEGADLNKQVAHIGTPLTTAIQKGDLAVVKYLVENGADVNKHVAHIGTPLSTASNARQSAITEYLISKGAR